MALDTTILPQPLKIKNIWILFISTTSITSSREMMLGWSANYKISTFW